MMLRSLLVQLSWGKAITTANDCRTVCIFKCVDSSMVLHCIMCKYRHMVMYVSAREWPRENLCRISVTPATEATIFTKPYGTQQQRRL